MLLISRWFVLFLAPSLSVFCGQSRTQRRFFLFFFSLQKKLLRLCVSKIPPSTGGNSTSNGASVKVGYGVTGALVFCDFSLKETEILLLNLEIS